MEASTSQQQENGERNSNERGSSDDAGGQHKGKKVAKSTGGSCQECIRTKAKCTRTWPCENCVRRGVAEFCPDRIARKSKYEVLRDKIADLEKENASLRDYCSKMPQLHTTSGSIGISSASPDSASAVTRWVDPHARAQNQAAAAGPSQSQASPANSVNSPHRVVLPLQFQNAQPSMTTSATPPPRLTDLATISQDLLEVANGRSASFVGHGASNLYKLENTATYSGSPDCLLGVFPFGDASVNGQQLQTTLLPTSQHARELVDVYFTSIDWMYRPISRERVDQDIQAVFTSGPQAVLPHELSRLLMVFALGTIFNFPIESTEPAQAGQTFSAIQQTAKAYFKEASKLLTQPGQHFLYNHSVTTCEVLHLMVSFLFVLGDGQAAKTAWPLLGLTTRLSQAVGLHKDPRTWTFLTRAEAVRRASVFWEVFTYDMLQCLNWGRPPSISYSHVSCPPPAELESWYLGADAAMGSGPSQQIPSSNSQVNFHTLKYDFAKLFNEVSSLLNGPGSTDVQAVLQLDRRLRNVELATPPTLRAQLDPYSTHAAPTPQGHMLALLLHKALLALHQPLFMRSLTAGGEPMISPYAASFNACIVSSRKHTEILKSVIRTNARAAYFWWFFLFHALNSAIIQGLVLLKVPDSMLAQEVFSDFRTSYETLASMAPRSELVRRALPVLSRLDQDIRAKLEPTVPALPALPALPLNTGGNVPESWMDQPSFDSQLWADMGNAQQLPYQTGTSTGLEGMLSDDEFASWLQNPTAMLTGPLDAEHADPANWSAKDPVLQTLLFWNPERNV